MAIVTDLDGLKARSIYRQISNDCYRQIWSLYDGPTFVD